MKPIIRVENIGKQYRLGTRRQTTLREMVAGMINSPLRAFRRTDNSRKDRSTL